MREYDAMQIPGVSKLNNSRGFSLIEVLLGISVFMIGMLGVTALNISSLKGGTFAGNMSEATSLAAGKIEELMVLDYDDPTNLNDTDADGTGQDTNDDGVDNTGGGNFGLDDTGAGADHSDLNVGTINMYNIYWNIAVDEPMSDNKTINVIVQWDIKGVTRQMNLEFTKMNIL